MTAIPATPSPNNSPAGIVVSDACSGMFLFRIHDKDGRIGDWRIRAANEKAGIKLVMDGLREFAENSEDIDVDSVTIQNISSPNSD